jgi:hypothetical protein
LTNALARNPIRGALCERLGERPIKFVFLVTEHPGIPDIEILDKLLDVRSALLTQDRVLHNLALGRGFQSFVHNRTKRRRLRAHFGSPDNIVAAALTISQRRTVRGTVGGLAISGIADPSWTSRICRR